MAGRTQQQFTGRRERSLELHRTSFAPLTYDVTSSELFCGYAVSALLGCESA